MATLLPSSAACFRFLLMVRTLFVCRRLSALVVVVFQPSCILVICPSNSRNILNSDICCIVAALTVLYYMLCTGRHKLVIIIWYIRERERMKEGERGSCEKGQTNQVPSARWPATAEPPTETGIIKKKKKKSISSRQMWRRQQDISKMAASVSWVNEPEPRSTGWWHPAGPLVTHWWLCVSF